MQRITLPNAPTQLAANVDVQDFDLGDGRFARVILEVNPEVVNDHLVMRVQAYEMTADGQFKMAPNGYPSRSRSTTHTRNATELHDTLEMGDAWVRHTANFDPTNPSDVETVQGKPTDPAAAYGVVVWDAEAQKLWRWSEGWANAIAKTAVTELLQVLATSAVRSGIAFR